MSPQPQREIHVHPGQERTRRTIAVGVALVFTTILTLSFVATVIFYSRHPAMFEEIAQNHFRGLMGPPMCAMTAMAIVSILRVTSGDIEFEAFGFKFKGASGPIVLWVITFLATVTGVATLW
jgi:hypothetical protein